MAELVAEGQRNRDRQGCSRRLELHVLHGQHLGNQVEELTVMSMRRPWLGVVASAVWVGLCSGCSQKPATPSATVQSPIMSPPSTMAGATAPNAAGTGGVTAVGQGAAGSTTTTPVQPGSGAAGAANATGDAGT